MVKKLFESCCCYRNRRTQNRHGTRMGCNIYFQELGRLYLHPGESSRLIIEGFMLEIILFDTSQAKLTMTFYIVKVNN